MYKHDNIIANVQVYDVAKIKRILEKDFGLVFTPNQVRGKCSSDIAELRKLFYCIVSRCEYECLVNSKQLTVVKQTTKTKEKDIAPPYITNEVSYVKRLVPLIKHPNQKILDADGDLRYKTQ